MDGFSVQVRCHSGYIMTRMLTVNQPKPGGHGGCKRHTIVHKGYHAGVTLMVCTTALCATKMLLCLSELE